ncbi:MAG: nucleotidyltransferase domain-containing protein [Acidobacteriia bacterium]|nr:nucleotidyltransferase domain-containing protein [Terriglobia bacterium]
MPLDPNARTIAEPNTILRGLVGSTVHGLVLSGTDDRDEMGVCVEPRRYVVGFGKFEHWVYRSAAEREGNQGARSQAGDLDLTIYSLRKWARLALQGNPTVLLLLYLPGDALVIRTKVGEELQRIAPAFASRHAGRRFLGYLEAQRQRLVGERGQRDVNRVELVERFGYDTKYAMHMLRLGHQGVEFLESDRLTLPMKEPVRNQLMDVRQGRSNLADVLAECTQLELRLGELLHSSPLPPEPDLQTVESFVMDTYATAWARTSESDQ